MKCALFTTFLILLIISQQQIQCRDQASGGNQVTDHSYPFMAALTLQLNRLPRLTSFCGRSIVTKQYILTAAHCLVNTSRVYIKLGTHKTYDNTEPGQQDFVSEEFKIHPEYTPNPSKLSSHDIGFIFLSTPIVYSDYVQPVKLPAMPMLTYYINFPSFLLGWGAYDETLALSPILKRVDSMIISEYVCIKKYHQVAANEYCVKSFPHHGGCDGDTGGPLIIYNDDNEEIQIAVFAVISSSGCDLTEPYLFTSIKWHAEYMENTVGEKLFKSAERLRRSKKRRARN